MAERRAVNKYYPVDWDPSKGSINRYRNSHPLRHRARKIDEGILVVRFGMPFNIWCLKCENHIGMGVRYNAEKSKIGDYCSIPVYKFRMKCRLCDNYFEIQTDPKNFGYEIISGARKQIIQADTDDVEELNLTKVDDDATRERKKVDAMFRLEKQVEGEIKNESNVSSLQELKQWRARWEDSFGANRVVRSQFRQRRKKIERNKDRDRKLLQKASLSIPLVKSDHQLKTLAKEMLNEVKDDRLNLELASRKRRILNSTIITRASVKTEAYSPQAGSSGTGPSQTCKTTKSQTIRIKREPG